LLLGVAAVAAGVLRRPTDSSVLFPLALLVALAVETAIGAADPAALGRYATPLAVFAAVGAAVSINWTAERFGPAVLVTALAACLALAAPSLRSAVRIGAVRGRAVEALAATIGPETRRAIRHDKLVAIDRRWQAALALSSGIPRLRVVPVEAVGGEVRMSRLGALIALRGAHESPPTPGLVPRRRARIWMLYLPPARPFSTEG
jgi:hypothetical protein